MNCRMLHILLCERTQIKDKKPTIRIDTNELTNGYCCDPPHANENSLRTVTMELITFSHFN